MSGSSWRLTHRFPFADLEKVVLGVFKADVDPSRKGKMLARFRKLQAIGLPLGDRPTRGKKTGYSLMQVCEVVLSLSLADFGLEPRHILGIFENARRTTSKHKYITINQAALEEVKQCEIHPDFVAELALYTIEEMVKECKDDRVILFYPNVLAFSWDEVPEIRYIITDLSEVGRGKVVADATRFAVVNLTVMGALIEEWLIHGNDPQA